jgi:hypothetical protein
VDGASADARSSSFPAARGGVAGVAVDTGSGPGVVWPVFLFILLDLLFLLLLGVPGEEEGERS